MKRSNKHIPRNIYIKGGIIYHAYLELILGLCILAQLTLMKEQLPTTFIFSTLCQDWTAEGASRRHV